MSIGLRLDLRQSQQLVMTPQLQQAIKLLAMSNIELTEFVETEVEKNPLLELAGSDGLPDRGEPPVVSSEQIDLLDGTPPAADARTEDHALTADTFDTGGFHLHDSAPSDGPPPIPGAVGGQGRIGAALPIDISLEDRLTDEISLRDHLLAQLGQAQTRCAGTSAVARYLIEELDEHGYLRTPLDDIAERLKVPTTIVDAALRLVQGCDPTGVGARTMAECLALQLAENAPLTPEMQALLDNIDLLTKGEVKPLAALCGVDVEALTGMIAQLRSLNPRPCAEFESIQTQTVVPDIILTRSDWGGWRLELNAETLPNVLLDRTYRLELGATDDTETRSYLSECQANASWLIKSLDQRARTILKVATEILRRQERFFEEGIAGLQPLTLKAVAEAISMHESTVSRVTSNKYMATDRGIFELKFFFTNGVGGEDGDIAASSVRHRIKAMVDAELKDNVLSDDAIVEALREEGIEIARRTVAKYRKSLRIPSSVDRRRLNALSSST